MADQELTAQQAVLARITRDTTGSDSAGQIVSEDSAALGRATQTEVIRPDGRITLGPDTQGGSSAVTPDIRSTVVKDINLDLPVRTLDDSQAITSSTTQAFPISVSDTGPQTVFQAGTGSRSDDAGTRNQTVQEVENRFDQSITPQDNVLDRYYSYTYNAELYLMNTDDYRNLLQTRRPDVSGGLLMRSGGITQTSGSVTVSIPGADQSSTQHTRNPFFSLDYYIDSIEIDNLVTGKGTGSSHQTTRLKFTVIEPNGITLIDNIQNAVKQYCGIENYAASIYVMIIKFYGYDQNGQIQRANNSNVSASQDPYAVVTKMIPFTLDNIKFSVANSLVTYEITGVPTGQSIAAGQARGTIPYNIELSGSTVGQVLGDDVSLTTQSATPTDSQRATAFNANTNASVLNAIQAQGSTSRNAPAKADAATNLNAGTIVGGLMGALNEFQRKLVKDGVFTVADEYSIEFAEETIRGARVKPVLNSAYSNTPMTNNANPRSMLDTTQAMNPNQRIVGITAGMPIVQAIDMVIRNSSYIEEQQLARVNEVTGERENTPRNTRAFAWFKVSMVTQPKGYDLKRNDYAYKIKFVVSFYEIKGMDSVWFPTGNFSGVHKSYPYWFTGKNTQVLEYTQQFNHAYRVTMSGRNNTTGQGTSDLQKIRKYWYAPRSNQSSQQSENGRSEPAANAAEYLYSQGDLGDLKMRIIGDPAWIMQGELFRGVDSRAFVYAPFLPDGTINYDAGEILFEVVWNRAGDYDLETGQMSPTDVSKSNNRATRQSFVYRATQVTSFFSQGRFEQQLNATVYIFPVPNTAQQARSDVNTARDQDATQSAIPGVNQLRYPVNNSLADATNRAAEVTDTVSASASTGTPAQNAASLRTALNTAAGQDISETQGMSVTALTPAQPAKLPTSDGGIDSPSTSLAGVQYNVTAAGENLNTPVPDTLPGINVIVIPTTDRQLMAKET